MKMAYADPPYLGCGRIYADLHPNALDFDNPETHKRLILKLERDYSDGWAMSLHSPSLRIILPMCPPRARVMAWVKPFCSFKPNVNPAYAWEPVIVCGGRPRTRWEDKARDWVAANIALKRTVKGAKPDAFCYWLFDVLNLRPEDEFVDMFPGSGAVTAAYKRYTAWLRGTEQGPLFETRE